MIGEAVLSAFGWGSPDEDDDDRDEPHPEDTHEDSDAEPGDLRIVFTYDDFFERWELRDQEYTATAKYRDGSRYYQWWTTQKLTFDELEEARRLGERIADVADDLPEDGTDEEVIVGTTAEY